MIYFPGRIRFFIWLGLGKAFGPLSCSFVVLLAICEVLSGDGRHQRVVRIAIVQKRTDRQKHFAYSQGRAPVVLENIQAYGALGVDIAVVDACFERDFGRFERVVGGEMNV